MTLKKNEWFAVLEFGNVDLLISQRDIADGGYTADVQKAFDSAGENGQIFFLDDFINRRFGFMSGDKIVTALKIKSEFPLFLVTSSVPKIKSFSLDELGALKGPIGESLLEFGVIGFRFEANRIQYLLDINKIMKNEYKEYAE